MQKFEFTKINKISGVYNKKQKPISRLLYLKYSFQIS